MWKCSNSLCVIVFIVVIALSISASNSQKITVPGIKGDALEEFSKEYSEYRTSGVISKKLQKIIDALLKPNDDIDCARCRVLANFVISMRRNGSTKAEMNAIIQDLCNIFKYMERKMCENTIFMHLEIILYIIDNTPGLSAGQVCGLKFQKGNCSLTDSKFDWKIDIDNRKPVNMVKPNSTVSNTTINILHLSDVHYDPKYQEGANALCGKTACCRHDQGIPDKKENGAGKWGDYRSCDTPKKAMEDAFQHIKLAHNNIDFIYFTGDMVDHAMWETTREGNLQSITTVLENMAKISNNIFPVLGNHESHPSNLFSPHTVNESVGTQWLYNKLAEALNSTIDISTVKKGGYYSALARPGLRVVGLNSNVAYIYNLWLLYDPTFPKEQLEWLHDILLNAERKNERVHILGHVPSGEHTNFITWDREYRRIIQRFSDTITGQFNGHSHNDEFKIYYNSSYFPINVAFNGGSITTYVNRNPNYKIYNVAAGNYTIHDVESWYYNLTKANSRGSANPEWKPLYSSFKTEFNISSLSSSEMHNLVIKMETDKELAKKYFEYKVKRGDPELQKGCNKDCMKDHLCAIVTTVSSDDLMCSKIIISSANSLQHLSIYSLAATILWSYFI